MKGLYASPLRVYLLIGIIALLGIYSGTKLPISLFPNASEPRLEVTANYGPMTADEYMRTYGWDLESQLQKIKTDDVKVERIESIYRNRSLEIDVTFRWGDNSDKSKREVESVVSQMNARVGNSNDMRIESQIHNGNSGFLVVSFYSKERTPNEIFQIIDPILSPKIKQVQDANNPNIWNPESEEIFVKLNVNALTNLQISVQSVEQSIRKGFETRQGGSILSAGKSIQVVMPRKINSLNDIGAIAIDTPNRRSVTLRDISNISLGPSSNASNIFKTSGAASVLLFSTPKPGGNIKAMAEDLIKEVHSALKLFPKDIEYKVLVDPSEFIESSIKNVFHEVLLGSFLAVLVLLIFIGSPKNVATAAIEIPISLVLAFILMRISGMNINLVSLGGLALSAGMNVDASVVVMENIFRHFEHHSGTLSRHQKLDIVIKAVQEVRGPVIASTISSLVVFIPLAFTSNLSYAILGDLAKAVVFSHAFSAVVALILVPTVRLHIMSRETQIQHPKSPIEAGLLRLESIYGHLLSKIIDSAKIKGIGFVTLTILFVSLFTFVLPKLPKEVIGKPETDWIWIGMDTEGHEKTKQMEMIADQVEREVFQKFSSKVSYVFYQIWNPNGAGLLVRLKDKSNMSATVKSFEEAFKNTATTKFNISAWNPSEFRLPNPPQLQIAISGSTPTKRAEATKELYQLLESKQIYPRLKANPEVADDHILQIQPKIDQWTIAANSGFHATFDDILEQLRTISSNRYLDYYPMGDKSYSVSVGLNGMKPQSVDELGSWTVAFGTKIVPLRAVATITKTDMPPTIHRINDLAVNQITSVLPEDLKPEAAHKKALATEIMTQWQKEFNAKNMKPEDRPTVAMEDGEVEITDSIHQLEIAIAWSVALIFLTMLIQFGSFMEPLIVLAAIPLGLIGVLTSLFVFRSSLSLNSALGVILLNGIAVANSIILVDFTKKLVHDGLSPIDAALKAAKTRLRPILITSLTTVLGMLPIAFGFGEGGKVLQPLGIAVAGGLWVSMLLTLFVVPALHVAYLKFSTSNIRNS